MACSWNDSVDGKESRDVRASGEVMASSPSIVDVQTDGYHYMHILTINTRKFDRDNQSHICTLTSNFIRLRTILSSF